MSTSEAGLCLSHLIISATSSVVGQSGPISPVLAVKGVLFDVYGEPGSFKMIDLKSVVN